MKTVCGCGHILAVYTLGNKKVRDVLCRCCRNRINKQLEQTLMEQDLERVRNK